MDGYRCLVMWDIKTACEKALEHFIKRYGESPKCEICGQVGYSWFDEGYSHLYSLEIKHKIHHDMYDAIFKYLWQNYPYHDYGNLTRHHLNYAKGICMFVCGSCHGRIHMSDDPEYAKYKPVDKKPMRKKLDYKMYKTLR